MNGWLVRMAVLVVVFAAAPFAADPARAERLTFDHRLSPALKAALDSGNRDLVHFDDRNPRYLYNLIVVQGTSQADWTEGLEIVTRLAGRKMASAQDWLDEMQARLPRGCSAQVIPLAQDATSLTFERRLSGCPPASAATGVYRIVAGRRSLFLLGALRKGDLDPERRGQWLQLLGSAQLAD